MASRSRRSSRMVEGFPLAECNPVKNIEESSQEDCLPFILDYDSSGPEGSPSLRRRPSMKSAYGFSPDSKVDRLEASPATFNNMDHTFKYGIATHKENSTLRLDSHKSSDISLTEPLKSMDQKPVNAQSRGANIFFYFFIIYYL